MDVVLVYLLLLTVLLNLEALTSSSVIIIDVEVMKDIVEFKNYDLSLRSPIKLYDLPYEKLESKKDRITFSPFRL